MDMLIFLYFVVALLWGAIDWFVARAEAGFTMSKSEIVKIFLMALLWPWRVIVLVWNKIKVNPVPPA